MVAFPNDENTRERFCIKNMRRRCDQMVAQDQGCIQYAGTSKCPVGPPLGPTSKVTSLSLIDGWMGCWLVGC
jgi:hypothetical protein